MKFQTNFVSEDALICYNEEMFLRSLFFGKFVSVGCFMQFLLRKKTIRWVHFSLYVATAKKSKLNQKRTFPPS